jgi:hypothetical protein
MSTQYNNVVFQSVDFGGDTIKIMARDKFYTDTRHKNLFAVECIANTGERIERNEGLSLQSAWNFARSWISTELFEI